jgi:hypothetical protein
LSCVFLHVTRRIPWFAGFFFWKALISFAFNRNCRDGFAKPVYEDSEAMGSPADLTLGTSQAPSTNATTNTATTTTTTTTVLSKSSPSSFVGDRLQRMRKLEEYLQSLEDERRKIEAFKRELPLCMQLLDESKLCPTTPPKT